MNLIIVESPTKARTLSRFLGKNYSIEATMGHIKDLPKSTLGVDLENNFKPQYEVVAKKNSSINAIKKAAKKAGEVYIATDPDREGEAIAQHVKDILTEKHALNTDKLKRIVFHEITVDAVTKSIEHPRGVDKNLVNAQIARRVLDRLVGYKLSPLLWRKVRRGLSAGRVQSVAVRLIVEREREIEAFKQDEYWEIFAHLKSKNQEVKDSEFVVQLVKIDDKKAEVKSAKDAKEIVNDLEKSDYKVADVRRREVRKHPYAPFTTSTMTQTAARFFGWSAKRTMSLAQKLYEEGLITYHRTDSTHLSEEAVKRGREYINKNYGDNYLPEKPRIYKTKSKVAQEAHEAIRPTNLNSKFDIKNTKYSKGADILYDIIWKRFVASQMADCIFDETRIDVEAKPHNAKIDYILHASGQVMKFDGWRRVIPLSKNEEPELPSVENNEALDLVKVNFEQKFTQPPPRYNEASLIKTLEKLGIGRPSTYAPTINTIQVRQYVQKEEGKFFPTPIGLAVNDFLAENFEKVMGYEFTAGMEENLDKVANGELDWQKMMTDFYAPFEEKLEDVGKNAKRVEIPAEKLGKKCPKCKEGELVVRIGRFGKFISCSRFPDCDYKDRYVEKIGMKCPECKIGDVIVKTTGKGRKFFGCSRYPECKFASWHKPS
jgi:DNA topoisomerase I